jgi:hypothetical protein
MTDRSFFFIATSTSMDTPGTTEDARGPTASTLKQLTIQLDQWRSSLPPELRWPEDDPTVFPESTKITRSYFQPLDPSLSTASESQQQPPLFTLNLNELPEPYPYAYDMQVAFLRTRFYYAKYIVNRPFVYKALHFPDQMTPADFSGVETCLKVRICHQSAIRVGYATFSIWSNNKARPALSGQSLSPLCHARSASYHISFAGRRLSSVSFSSYT